MFHSIDAIIDAITIDHIDIIGMAVSDSLAADFVVYDGDCVYDNIDGDGGYIRIDDNKVIDIVDAFDLLISW